MIDRENLSEEILNWSRHEFEAVWREFKDQEDKEA